MRNQHKALSTSLPSGAQLLRPPELISWDCYAHGGSFERCERLIAPTSPGRLLGQTGVEKASEPRWRSTITNCALEATTHAI